MRIPGVGHPTRKRRSDDISNLILVMPGEGSVGCVTCTFSPRGCRPRVRHLVEGGLRTPETTPLASSNHVPARPPALRLPLGGHAIPGLSYGLAIRARGPRPSEGTTLHIIPGFSTPKGLSPTLAPRGGAGSARPQGRHHADPNIAPSWPPASRKGTGGNAMPCHSSGRTVRARRPRPSERTTPPHYHRVFPERPLTHACPPGGAGSARPERRHHANPNIAPSWPPASRKGTGANAMPCHSSGRTVRARRPRPSEKTAFRVIPWPSRARPS